MSTTMANRELTIATATTRNTTRWTNTFATKQDLTAKAYDPITVDTTPAEYQAMTKAQRDQIKDVGGYVAGHLKDGRRRKGHVHNRSMITLDIDNLPANTDLIDALTNRLDCAWLAHTTLSHTTKAPRWRLWVWLTHNVTPDEYEAIARRIAQDLNPGLAWFDGTTFQPERFMYQPSTLNGGEYQVEVSHGKPELEPDDVLARYDAWTDLTTWPGITPDTLPKNSGKLDDPRNKPGIIGAFNRAYTIDTAIKTFIPDVYKPGTVKNRWTYTGGTSSNGLIVYDAGTRCYSQHTTDPANDGHTHSPFDLIRTHLYAHLDEDTSEQMPANRKPSYLAMLTHAEGDAKTRKENAKSTAETISEVFTQLPEAATATAGEQASDTTDPLAWLEQLEPKRGGGFADTLGNLNLIFTHDPNLNHIAWNEHAERIEIQDPTLLPWAQLKPGWTENDTAQLASYIDRTYQGLYSPTKMETAFKTTATTRAFHPVRDYFNHLPPWDGIPRLDTLLIDTLGAPDTHYTRAVTRKTLVAAVRRTFHPGAKFDYVLTLVGPQGIGKSTIFARLANPWFSDALTITDMKDKTGAEKLLGNLIVEVAELAGMRKMDAETVKGFITRTDDKYRAAYGRTVESHPRQGIIVGSTNATEGFLRDATGNRRWWTVDVTGNGTITVQDLTQTDIDQIWAETVKYEQEGETLYLTGDIAAVALEHQAAAVEADDRVGIVQEYLDTQVPTNWDTLPLSIRRIYLAGGEVPLHLQPNTLDDGLQQRSSVSKIEIWCECFGREPDTMRKIDSHEITAIMQQLDDWEDSGKTKRLPIYGKQRLFTRTHVLAR